MEKLLHHIWKHRLFDDDRLLTSCGMEVEILDVGSHNLHGGPDFFNAKIRINGTLWAGNVEIHTRASDWYAHAHHTDPNYDSVILHVVEELDKQVINSKGQEILQLVLPVSQAVRQQADRLIRWDTSTPCQEQLFLISSLQWENWKNRLLVERMEQKCSGVWHHLERTQYDWEEVMYIALARSFGFNTNNDPFERLAVSLPFNLLRKESGIPFHLDALIFGQAGFLEDERIEEPFYLHLQREYHFLRHKYGLVPLELSCWNFGGVRKGNFPTIRLAQFVALLSEHEHLFSNIDQAHEIQSLRKLLGVVPHAYWNNHFTFGLVSREVVKKGMGANSIDSLIINAVVPVLFALGRHYNAEEYQDRAFDLLRAIPAERNAITKHWDDLGVPLSDAADTQALIQLYKGYCLSHKCLFCQIGNALLKHSKKLI
jgi:hypothetical protein